MAKQSSPKPAAPKPAANPNYPSTTGNDSGKDRGNTPKPKGK